MTNNIAYRFIRSACKYLLGVFAFMLLVLLILPFTLISWTWLLQPVYLAALTVALLGNFYCILMIAKPQFHQVFWRLKKYGSPQSIAAQIDADAERYVDTVILSKAGYTAIFTPSWLIWSTGAFALQVKILNFADIKQIYQHTTITNGFAQYSLDIRTNEGRKTHMDFYRNEGLIGEIMSRIQQHAPSVKVGYGG